MSAYHMLNSVQKRTLTEKDWRAVPIQAQFLKDQRSWDWVWWLAIDRNKREREEEKRPRCQASWSKRFWEEQIKGTMVPAKLKPERPVGYGTARWSLLVWGPLPGAGQEQLAGKEAVSMVEEKQDRQEWGQEKMSCRVAQACVCLRQNGRVDAMYCFWGSNVLAYLLFHENSPLQFSLCIFRLTQSVKNFIFICSLNIWHMYGLFPCFQLFLNFKMQVDICNDK